MKFAVLCVAAMVALCAAKPTGFTLTKLSSKTTGYTLTKVTDKLISANHLTMVDIVNKSGAKWRAGPNARFMNATDEYILRQMGARLDGPKLPEADIKPLSNIPESFDARQQWGSMCPSTKEVRDQANCGSCWAFGAVEAMTDRICIASNGTSQPHISAEDLLTCAPTAGSCNGGFPEAAWAHFKTSGLVTGGQYGTKQGCQPYSLPHCDHHVSGKYPACSGEGPTPACKRSCIDGYDKSYEQDKHYGQSAYSVSSDVEKIQTEIMTKGPVEGAFTVFQDFLTYKSGVYHHVSGPALGGHAIKIIGWGTDNGTPYWTVTNSWNEDWGNQGYFNIRRGSNECGIESGIVAGDVKV